jgi:hypothetical protein
MSDSTHSETSNKGLEKVWMELKKEWGWPYATESMWAEKLGDNLYALRNVPFYARGLSYDDRVQTEIRDELRQVVKVVDRGGHSTYRIFAAAGRHSPAVNTALERIHANGCGLEAANDKHVAIDIPPEVDVFSIYNLLDEAEKQGLWEFEEGHCGHPVSKRRPPPMA